MSIGNTEYAYDPRDIPEEEPDLAKLALNLQERIEYIAGRPLEERQEFVTQLLSLLADLGIEVDVSIFDEDDPSSPEDPATSRSTASAVADPLPAARGSHTNVENTEGQSPGDLIPPPSPSPQEPPLLPTAPNPPRTLRREHTSVTRMNNPRAIRRENTFAQSTEVGPEGNSLKNGNETNDRHIREASTSQSHQRTCGPFSRRLQLEDIAQMGDEGLEGLFREAYLTPEGGTSGSVQASALPASSSHTTTSDLPEDDGTDLHRHPPPDISHVGNEETSDLSREMSASPQDRPAIEGNASVPSTSAINGTAGQTDTDPAVDGLTEAAPPLPVEPEVPAPERVISSPSSNTSRYPSRPLRRTYACANFNEMESQMSGNSVKEDIGKGNPEEETPARPNLRVPDDVPQQLQLGDIARLGNDGLHDLVHRTYVALPSPIAHDVSSDADADDDADLSASASDVSDSESTAEDRSNAPSPSPSPPRRKRNREDEDEDLRYSMFSLQRRRMRRDLNFESPVEWYPPPPQSQPNEPGPSRLHLADPSTRTSLIPAPIADVDIGDNWSTCADNGLSSTPPPSRGATSESAGPSTQVTAAASDSPRSRASSTTSSKKRTREDDEDDEEVEKSLSGSVPSSTRSSKSPKRRKVGL